MSKGVDNKTEDKINEKTYLKRLDFKKRVIRNQA